MQINFVIIEIIPTWELSNQDNIYINSLLKHGVEKCAKTFNPPILQ